MKGFANLALVLLASLLASGTAYGITAEELERLLNRKEALTLIDVRSKTAYKEAHIPGAINIPEQLIGMKRLPPLGRVIVYGSGIDEGPAMEAVNALSQKPGITAEWLEGGIFRWEALDFPSTREKGLERGEPHYIPYQELEAIASSNPDMVLLDLRETYRSAGRESPPDESQVNANRAVKTLTDLSMEFPGASVVRSSRGEAPIVRLTALAEAGNLSVQDRDHVHLYVLIDNGDGRSEEMARWLKEVGIKRFVILAGGEEALVRKGQPGSKKTVTRVRHE